MATSTVLEPMQTALVDGDEDGDDCLRMAKQSFRIDRPKFDLVIAHGGRCMDGLMSAALALQLNPEATVVMWRFHEELPCLSGKSVLFVDAVPPHSVLAEAMKTAKRVVVVDHHPDTASLVQSPLFVGRMEDCIYSSEHSAVMLLYCYYYGDYKAPQVFHYVEDRDLWKKQMVNSDIVNNGLAAYTAFDLGQCCKIVDLIWQQAANDEKVIADAAQYGKCLQQAKDASIESALKNMQRVKLYQSYDTLEFGITNYTEHLSDIGSAMVNLPPAEHSGGKPLAFAVVWYFSHATQAYHLSFRSSDRQSNVSVLAKAFSGGGHRNASGATLYIDDYGAPDDLVKRIVEVCAEFGRDVIFAEGE